MSLTRSASAFVRSGSAIRCLLEVGFSDAMDRAPLANFSRGAELRFGWPKAASLLALDAVDGGKLAALLGASDGLGCCLDDVTGLDVDGAQVRFAVHSTIS